MDPRLETTLALLTGFGIRIVVPLLLTVLLVVFLRRIDAHWQEESIQLGTDEAGREFWAKTAQTPCWEVRNCPPEKRESCPAYAHQEFPCWQVFRSPDGPLKEACLDCAVFHNAPIPLAAAD
jgi:hypothetical protein